MFINVQQTSPSWYQVVRVTRLHKLYPLPEASIQQRWISGSLKLSILFWMLLQTALRKYLHY